MSFHDDAIEPLAVESAEHFAELVKRAAERTDGSQRGFGEERRERSESLRVLPRELGN
jgi:hypothetical protein